MQLSLNKSKRSRNITPERKSIMEMQVGDVLRLSHPNYVCDGIGSSCSLLPCMKSWSESANRKYESKHDGAGIVVIKRIK